MKPRCDGCRHGGQVFVVGAEAEKRVPCLRLPPQLVSSPNKDGVPDIRSQFPIVMPDFKCSEFRPRGFWASLVHTIKRIVT